MKEKILNYPKFVIDCETNALEIEDVNRIHSLGWCNTLDGNVCSTTHYGQMRDLLTREDIIIVGHNFKLYDQKVLEKVLGIEIKCHIYDTLAISWVVENTRDKHSLGSYEAEFGYKKVEITDWENLSSSDYILRVEEDVRINYKLWVKQAKYLNNLYEGNHKKIHEFLQYLELKLDCVKEHQQVGIKLDIDLCKKSMEELEAIKEVKMSTLREAMPKRAIKSVKNPPKVMFKANGEPSENRTKWLKFLEEQNLPESWNEPVEYVVDYEIGNPSSHLQIKNWLESLQWKPQHFKYVRDGKTQRKIPQIKSKDDNDGSVCPSIIKLMEKEPSLEALDSLYILGHRISLFKAFQRDQKNGRLYQGILGLATSLRHQHAVIVNLPLPSRPYAENVRKSLIVEEGNVFLGCDLSSLENQCSKHFIHDFDKNLFNQLNDTTIDPHLSLGIEAGLITLEEAEFYKKFDKSKDDHEKYNKIKEKRSISKTSRYALSYKCGIPKLALAAGVPEKLAKKIYDAYWKANKAVLDFENSLEVKTIGAQMWMKQPVNQFWYPLRNQKDRYSLACQGLGDYIFYTWCKYVREQGIKLTFTYHDELLIEVPDEEAIIESVKSKVKKALDKVNQEFKLNVTIESSTAIGINYKEVH